MKLEYRYGGEDGKRHSLIADKQLVVVRTRRGRSLLRNTPVQPSAFKTLGSLKPVVRFPSAGVEVFRSDKPTYKQVRTALKDHADIRFVGQGLCDPKSKQPVVYTENLFIKFNDDAGDAEIKKLLKKHSLTIKRTPGYAPNAYFVGAKEGTGRATFEMADDLLSMGAVELCHPELVREAHLREAFPEQWHLMATEIDGTPVDAHANVRNAWGLSRGEGMVIAIIDDGVDIGHEEFASAGKIVAPYNATLGTTDARPGTGDRHGTACAGVACADGLVGASGVAPRSALIPIRLYSGLGSQAEANAIEWAYQHGADVISCSWGPVDGRWWDDNDPAHDHVVGLPDSTRLAIEAAIRDGRDGKGCVITWAAGNGGESVENDGYASDDHVIAVAACNDRGKQSAYSDHGESIWCSFPSNDGIPTDTPGIWTTDRSGREGYNEGHPSRGDAQGDYTNSFGGTSSAAPGAAGVAALILARNPDLRWDEVHAILRQTCDKIDVADGGYDAQGHSNRYGYGRVNAAKAVQLAAPPAYADYTAIHTAIQDVAIRDLKESELSVEVGDSRPIRDLRVSVDIEHTYQGDLTVRLHAPADGNGDAPPPIVLHRRTGGGLNNIKQLFHKDNLASLQDLIGRNPQGTWTLKVDDAAQMDEGVLRSFSVELLY